jgi:putative membrane protein (TIGR04086 family)
VIRRVRWLLAIAAGFVAELFVFAIVFLVLYLWGQTAFLVSILVASAVMPFVGAMWVGRRVASDFVMHGAIVGLVAALAYVAIAWGQPEPALYKIAHGLKLIGGALGGKIAASRYAATRRAITIQSA